MFNHAIYYENKTQILSCRNEHRQLNIIYIDGKIFQNTTMVIPIPVPKEEIELYLHLDKDEYVRSMFSKLTQQFELQKDTSTTSIFPLIPSSSSSSVSSPSIPGVNSLKQYDATYTTEMISNFHSLKSWSQQSEFKHLYALLEKVYSSGYSFLVFHFKTSDTDSSLHNWIPPIVYSYALDVSNPCFIPILRTQYTSATAKHCPMHVYVAGFDKIKHSELKAPLVSSEPRKLFQYDCIPLPSVISSLLAKHTPREVPVVTTKCFRFHVASADCATNIYIHGTIPPLAKNTLSMASMFQCLLDDEQKEERGRDPDIKLFSLKEPMSDAIEMKETTTQTQSQSQLQKSMDLVSTSPFTQPPVSSVYIGSDKDDNDDKDTRQWPWWIEESSVIRNFPMTEVVMPIQGEKKSELVMISTTTTTTDDWNPFDPVENKDSILSTLQTMNTSSSAHSTRSAGSTRSTDVSSSAISKKTEKIVKVVDVQCNCCSESISLPEIWFRCKLCPDFDVCIQCFTNKIYQRPQHTSTNHPFQHLFVVLHSQEQRHYLIAQPKPFIHLQHSLPKNSSQSPLPLSQYPLIKCSYCQHKVLGFLYSCQDTSCKIQMCESCLETSTHSIDHPLLRTKGILAPL